ncbi:MAG: chitobiase/beta-hexosaminidase C-terminal domain-containing protein [Oscillospiraceae bacterium]|nr:chitobiase/beta-hexosaminidase C-terminal domain-containing protein [Oscillospiraceae bacterium]
MKKRIRKISAVLLASTLAVSSLPAAVFADVQGVTGNTSSTDGTSIAALTAAQKPTAKTGLAYTGKEQELLNAPVEPVPGYTILYRLAGGEWSEDIPTGKDAGKYVVNVKYVKGEEERAIDPITVTIAKAVAPTSVTAKTGLMYTGQAQELVNAPSSVPASYKVQYSLDGGETWSDDIPTGIHAGEYTVSTKLAYTGDDGSYNDVDGNDVIATIAKAAAPTLTAEQMPTIIEGLVYDGSDQDLINAPAEDIEGYTIKYSVSGGDFDEAIPTGLHAGSYTIKVQYEGDDDHMSFDGAVLGNTIAKLAAPETLPTAQMPTAKDDLVYNEEEQELLNAPAEAPEGYTINYSLDGDWSEDIPTGVDAAEYNVKVRYIGDSDHSDFEIAQIVATINKAKAELGAVPRVGLVYTGEAQELVIAPPYVPENYTVKYSLDGGQNWTASIPTGTNAGDYTVSVKYEGDKNHEDIFARDLNVTIAKATVLLTEAQKPTAKAGLIYTGKDQELVNAPAEKLSHYTLKYKVNGGEWSEKIPTGNAAGTYTVQAKYFVDKASAQNCDDVDAGEIEVTIAVAEGPNGPVAIEGLEYNGEAQALVIAPTYLPEGYAIKYSLDGENWSDAVPTGTNAGKYIVKVKYVGDNNHEDFNGKDVEVIIAEVPSEITDAQRPTAKEGLVYNAEKQELVNAPAEAAEGYTLKYSLDGEVWAEEIPTGFEVGEYKVLYMFEGDENHLDVDGDELTVTIAEPAFVPTDAQKPTAKEGLTVTGEAQALLNAPAEAAEGYSLMYGLDGEEWSEEIPTGTDAGEYTVKYKFVGEDEEEILGEDITVTIAEAAIELTDAQKPTAKEGLKATGAAQELVNAPAEGLDGYAIKYSLDGEEWSEEIPTGTAAGEYTVKYKYVNEEDAEVAGEDIKVTIDEVVKPAKPTVVIKTAFGGRTVQLNCADPDAEIYYSFGTSAITSECEHVKAGETVFIDTPRTGKEAAMYFKAYKDGQWSEVGKWGVLNVKIAQPIIRQSGKKDSIKFRIYTQTKDSYIVYTIDGSDPSIEEGTQKLIVSNGNLIWGTNAIIEVPKGTTIKAIAIRNGLVTSDIMTYTNN